MSKNTRGYFGIPKVAIDALIELGAPAQTICAYLVIAKSTDRTNIFSTAGLKSIRTALHIGEDRARKIVEELCNIEVQVKTSKGLSNQRILYTAEDWKRLSGNEVPGPVGTRGSIRYIINAFNGKMVYFGNSIVDGYRKGANFPLSDLCTVGDAAARLLLLLYTANDMEQWGGINPVFLHRRYDGAISHNLPEKHKIYSVVRDSTVRSSKKIVSSVVSDKKEDNFQEFWSAVDALIDVGFIYEAVEIFNMDPSKFPDEARMVYPLHTYDKYGKPSKGEVGVLTEMRAAAAEWAPLLSDTLGKPDRSRLFFVVPKYIATPIAIGVYRVKYRASVDQTVRGISTLASLEGKALEWAAEAKQLYHAT